MLFGTYTVLTERRCAHAAQASLLRKHVDTQKVWQKGRFALSPKRAKNTDTNERRKRRTRTAGIHKQFSTNDYISVYSYIYHICIQILLHWHCNQLQHNQLRKVRDHSTKAARRDEGMDAPLLERVRGFPDCIAVSVSFRSNRRTRQ